MGDSKSMIREEAAILLLGRCSGNSGVRNAKSPRRKEEQDSSLLGVFAPSRLGVSIRYDGVENMMILDHGLASLAEQHILVKRASMLLKGDPT
ncbi:MAG TPA: hypothetical protein VGM98_23170 [Schlesneria sp.]